MVVLAHDNAGPPFNIHGRSPIKQPTLGIQLSKSKSLAVWTVLRGTKYEISTALLDYVSTNSNIHRACFCQMLSHEG